MRTFSQFRIILKEHAEYQFLPDGQTAPHIQVNHNKIKPISDEGEREQGHLWALCSWLAEPEMATFDQGAITANLKSVQDMEQSSALSALNLAKKYGFVVTAKARFATTALGKLRGVIQYYAEKDAGRVRQRLTIDDTEKHLQQAYHHITKFEAEQVAEAAGSLEPEFVAKALVGSEHTKAVAPSGGEPPKVLIANFASKQQAQIIDILYDEGAASVQDIAKQTKLTPVLIQNCLNKLEQAGYVRKEDGLWEFTEKGKDTLEKKGIMVKNKA